MSTTAQPLAPLAAPAAAPATPPRAEVLRRAEGVELIGRFEDSGFREPPMIIRRGDGQVVQLTDLLYAIVEAADGRRDVAEIAEQVGARCGRAITAGNVAALAESKLRPLGALALPDGTSPALPKHEPLMALRHRRPLLSEDVVNSGARRLTWLHIPAVTVAVLLALVSFDVWLFGFHGIAGGLRSVIYEPLLFLAVLASVVLGTAFHEFGHASASRHCGARPGVMGVGLYLVWPAFYCDVTDAYRLNRRGRLRTDLGGVYFNGIFALLLGGVYAVTGQPAALFAAFLQHVLAVQQLMPLLRFDGYYVLTDLSGVPDILSRIKPIFRSMIPGRPKEPRVAELKPSVRFIVTAYLMTLVPLLLLLFSWMIVSAPRILATVWDSFGLQLDRLGETADPAGFAAGVCRVALLLLPIAAMSLSLSRVGRMASRGAVRWSRDSAARTLVAITTAAVLVAGLGYLWSPDRDGAYEPIRPEERGTIGDGLAKVHEQVPTPPAILVPASEGVQPGPVARKAERRLERAGGGRGAGSGGGDARPAGEVRTKPKREARDDSDDSDEETLDPEERVGPDGAGTTTTVSTTPEMPAAPDLDTYTSPTVTGPDVPTFDGDSTTTTESTTTPSTTTTPESTSTTPESTTTTEDSTTTTESGTTDTTSTTSTTSTTETTPTG